MSRARADRIAERRREVLQQLEQADRELADLRALRETLHDDDEHDPDGVSLSSEWSRLEGLRRSHLGSLTAIEEAAARLARGEDGVCSVCGNPIAPERLEARPDTTTCINCAH